jgi:hypothetical protein
LGVPDNGQPGQYTQTLSYFREASIGKGKDDPAEDPDSTIEEQLAIAKIHRTRAETARQKIVNELMEAAKELYQKLVSEREQTLEKAKQRDAQSELKHLEAQRELERAQSVKAEANTYQERVIAQAQQQAKAIKAEAEAFREKLLTEVQQQAQEELDRAQAARAEADAYREKVLAQTQQQALDILRQVQLAAEQQGAGIRRKYSIEAEKRLGN